jgi:hypothetical protein
LTVPPSPPSAWLASGVLRTSRRPNRLEGTESRPDFDPHLLQSADRDRLAFAENARDLNAGDTLQRLGNVGVRQLADVLSCDHVHDLKGFALDLGRTLQRGADAGDDDVLPVGRRRAIGILRSGGLLRRLLRSGHLRLRLRGERTGRQDCDRRRGEQAPDPGAAAGKSKA